MNEAIFLNALHESPTDAVTWLALADWLEETVQSDRAELVRLTQELRTLRNTRRTKRRAALVSRITTLLEAGVRPLVPEIVNSIGMTLALIPPGAFLMGSPASESERHDTERSHKVVIARPFYLGVFAVTQAQYKQVTRKTPSSFSSKKSSATQVAGLDTDQFPVEMVSWNDAAAFCRQLREKEKEVAARRVYRLPTEAEWEYACRAGSAAAFHTGDTLNSAQANINGGHPYGDTEQGPYLERTCAVGSYPPNAFGLYEMHGNVYEWCADWYDRDYYTHSPEESPTGPDSGQSRVMRGGSWYNYGHVCRAAYRSTGVPGTGAVYYGIRVAMDWNPPEREEASGGA